MKIFECEKCKSKEVFISESGKNIGLYCADCGKWIKWLNKDELKLAERQIKAHDREIRNKALDEFAEAIKYEIREGNWRFSRLDFGDVDEIAEQLKGVQE